MAANSILALMIALSLPGWVDPREGLLPTWPGGPATSCPENQSGAMGVMLTAHRYGWTACFVIAIVVGCGLGVAEYAMLRFLLGSPPNCE
ncbi:MAG: hypothetical protein KF688_10225 [Pirellulales bacterium]|nr:hypothetical protein [Pirellulales bacterium]